MTSSSATADRLIDVLDRLDRHVTAVAEGSTSAKDDLANVLHLMIGEGRGAGLVYEVADELATDPPTMKGWPDTSLPGEKDGNPVLVSFRSVAGNDSFANGGIDHPLDDALAEDCLRFAATGSDSAEHWSWRRFVMLVRHKYGSHTDLKPPEWLTEVRLYLASDTDVVSFLLWSLGRELRAIVSKWLADHVEMSPYDAGSSYLGGIDLGQALFIAEGSSKLDVQARVRFEQVVTGRNQPVVGGMFDGKPFLLGLTGAGEMSFLYGADGDTLDQLRRKFLATAFKSRPNRAARRAAQRRRRRKG